MAKNSFIQDMIKSSSNEYADIASEGIRTSDIDEFIDTGSYILNALISGSIYKGLPENKTLALAGETSTGKTYAALTIVKNFLDKYENSVVFYFDSESAVTSDMIKNRNICSERVVVMPIDTIENFRHQVFKILEYYNTNKDENKPRIMIVLDSLGQLSSSKEIDDISNNKDKRDMTKQQLLKSTFRSIALKKAIAKIPMVITSHTYKKIGSMFPENVMSGGSGLQYTADIIVFLSKSKMKDGDSLVGNNIRCTLKKGRFTKEGSVSIVGLSFDKGLLPYNGLVDLAEKYDIFEKISKKFKLPDGRTVFQKTIEKNPEDYFTDEILDKLDDAAKKEFCYGSDIEYEEENA
jgi:RecA/RadA recombinase